MSHLFYWGNPEEKHNEKSKRRNEGQSSSAVSLFLSLMFKGYNIFFFFCFWKDKRSVKRAPFSYEVLNSIHISNQSQAFVSLFIMLLTNIYTLDFGTVQKGKISGAGSQGGGGA